MVKNASMALKIGVDLPLDPISSVEFEHFDQKKFSRPTMHCIVCNSMSTKYVMMLHTMPPPPSSSHENLCFPPRRWRSPPVLFFSAPLETRQGQLTATDNQTITKNNTWHLKHIWSQTKKGALFTHLLGGALCHLSIIACIHHHQLPRWYLGE